MRSGNTTGNVSPCLHCGQETRKSGNDQRDWCSQVQQAKIRAGSTDPRLQVNALVPLFGKGLAETEDQLRQGLQFHVRPSENGSSWEVVTEHCCLGGCDMKAYTFLAERDALCFAALLKAVGYEPPHNFACPACYAEYMKDCI